ncbi:hypothetical protein ACHQM5_028068 [Ranunculus cassubicifolius]
MEGSKLVSLGASKLVPNIQELAKQPLDTIPPRYVRSDLEVPIIASNPALTPTVPSMDSELDRLNSACKDWGFFQVAGETRALQGSL